jgi:hypothetical protein
MAVAGACAIGVALAMWLLWASARAAITVVFARVRNGELEVIRGGLSPRVLADLRDVVARPPIVRATMRIVRNRGRAKLDVHGYVEGHQLQQLRNVIGNVTLAQLLKTNRR